MCSNDKCVSCLLLQTSFSHVLQYASSSISYFHKMHIVRKVKARLLYHNKWNACCWQGSSQYILGEDDKEKMLESDDVAKFPAELPTQTAVQHSKHQ